MIDPQIVVNTVSTALTAIQTLIGIAKERKDTDLIGKIMDLYGAILQLQSTLAGYQQENTSLQEELTRLKQEHAIQEQLEYRSSVYWRTVGESRESFCPLCWDVDRKLVHTQKFEGAYEGTYRRCEIHKANFLDTD